MTTGAPVRGDEVEVVAGDVQTLRVVGKPEADQTSRDVAKLEGGLVLDDLYEGWVGLALAGHAARPDVLEVSVYADGAAHRSPTDNSVQVVTERLEAHRHGQRLGRIRLEDGDHGEWGPGSPFDSVGPSVGLYLVEAAVQADHLAVESVERAQSEISTIPEFGEADVALVFSLQQGIDGRSLEERMVEVLVPTEIPLPKVLDMQRTHQRGIDRHQANLAFVTIKPMFHSVLLFGYSMGFSQVRQAVIRSCGRRVRAS
jgi:hypothetical protein